MIRSGSQTARSPSRCLTAARRSCVHPAAQHALAEALDERPGEGSSPAAQRPICRASIARTAAALSPSAARSASVTAPWRLAGAGRRRRGSAARARTPGVGETEASLEPDLARRAVEQVVAADDLADTLVGVVDTTARL